MGSGHNVWHSPSQTPSQNILRSIDLTGSEGGGALEIGGSEHCNGVSGLRVMGASAHVVASIDRNPRLQEAPQQRHVAVKNTRAELISSLCAAEPQPAPHATRASAPLP